MFRGSKIWNGQQTSNIRYCDLPKNAKLCIDLYLETKVGITMTLGCVCFNVFDQKGKLKNKDKGFNVWPFYSHDARLGCMKEYGGVSSKVFKILDKKRKKCHAKMYLKFHQFCAPIMHANRNLEAIQDDNEIMTKLTLSKTNSTGHVRMKNLSFSEKDIM